MKKDYKEHTFNYDYLKKKIKDYLDYYDLELEDLAISIGMTERTLKKTLNNERDFFVSEIFRFSEILRLTDKERNKAFFTVLKGGAKDEK